MAQNNGNWCSPPRHYEDRTGIHPSCACDLVAVSGLFCAPPVHCSGVLQANGPEASTSTSSQMMGSASVQTLHQRGPHPGGCVPCWWRGGCKSPDSELGPRPHHGVHDLHTSPAEERQSSTQKTGEQLLETKNNPI